MADLGDSDEHIHNTIVAGFRAQLACLHRTEGENLRNFNAEKQRIARERRAVEAQMVASKEDEDFERRKRARPATRVKIESMVVDLTDDEPAPKAERNFKTETGVKREAFVKQENVELTAESPAEPIVERKRKQQAVSLPTSPEESILTDESSWDIVNDHTSMLNSQKVTLADQDEIEDSYAQTESDRSVADEDIEVIEREPKKQKRTSQQSAEEELDNLDWQVREAAPMIVPTLDSEVFLELKCAFCFGNCTQVGRTKTPYKGFEGM
ncbi:hypothetical protein LTR17_004792 [Elasticomyces elasticus]|nr:hypothetical protein LTR17_004792 [Elasticomyces elasticus]